MENAASTNPDFFDIEEKEPKRSALILRYIFSVAAIFSVLGILHMAGVYQALLFRRTPPPVEQEEVESRLDAETFALPLRVFVFVNEGNLGSERSKEEVMELIENADKIWDQAAINLSSEEAIFLERSDEEIQSFLDNPSLFAGALPRFTEEGANVFLVRSLKGLNGIAFTKIRSVVVADLTTVYDFRVLAHEIGHILGLEHVSSDPNRLMYKGANGFALTLNEVFKARESLSVLRESY